MKKSLFLLTLIISYGCQAPTDQSEQMAVQNDTIQTASGLQYYFIKKGEGRKIEEGSYVAAYNRLYLNDVDTVFWSTDNDQDSVFTFIEGKTPLIKGALELYPLLHEGDELVAIMPDSIAYGKEDTRGLPGGSTLIFNPIIIKSVSEPKKVLTDTLYAVFESGSVEDMMNTYHSIVNSSLSNNYHMHLKLMRNLINKMMEDKRFSEAEEAADQFETISIETADVRWFGYLKIEAIALQGDTTRAILLAEQKIAKDPEVPYWKEILSDLKKKSK